MIYVYAEDQMDTGKKTLTLEAKQAVLQEVVKVWQKYLHLEEKDIFRLDADHFSMLQPPAVKKLSEYLGSVLL